MTIEQRKLELITWITTIQNEGMLKRIEDFYHNPEPEIPDTILELLQNQARLNWKITSNIKVLGNS